MSDRIFPIKTKTACALKWSWSTLYLYQGQTASCHRTGFSEINVDNFDQFHNTEKKLQERLDMLDGKWPDGSCGYCRHIEESGGFSDRNLHARIPNLYPTELDIDPTLTKVNPTILEVFFDNVCNLSCVYCLPTLSSKLNQEYKTFGPFNTGSIRLNAVESNSTSSLIGKFWNWLDSNSLQLKRLNVLGGEPFYQTEFYQLLDFFDRTAHPNLELCIISNLVIPTNKLQTIVNRFEKLLASKKLKRIDITCSIDCWGPEQEYVRYGLDLDLWQKNFEFLLSKKWIKLNINQTISVLTIKTMPDLLSRLEGWRKIRSIGHFFSVVTPQPPYLDPSILGKGIFKSDFDKIIASMPIESAEHNTAVEYMQSIATSIENAEVNLEELKNLKVFLDEKDRRRGTNWKITFPWLVQIFNQCIEDCAND